MSYTIDTETAKLGGNSKFTLDDPNMRYLIGIRYFKLSFGSHDHHLHEAMISLTSEKDGATVNVKTEVAFEDASKHHIDLDASEVELVCVATSDPSAVIPEKLEDLRDGLSKNVFGMDGRDPIIPSHGAVVLQGFEASFDSPKHKDHHIKQITASLSLVRGATVEANLMMKDSSGNEAKFDCQAGLIGTQDDPTFIIDKVKDVQFERQQVDFERPVAEAQALITGFKAEFGGKDHHVKTLEVGTKGGVTVDGNNVIIPASAGASLFDDSGNRQDTLSHVDFVIFAVMS